MGGMVEVLASKQAQHAISQSASSTAVYLFRRATFHCEADRHALCDPQDLVLAIQPHEICVKRSIATGAEVL